LITVEPVPAAPSETGDRVPTTTAAQITVFPDHGNDERLSRDLSTVVHWLHRYVSEPLPHIGRSGPVCPFVPAALSDDAVRFSFHYGVDGRHPDQLITLLDKELDTFDRTAPPVGRAGTSLASLIIALPDTGQDGWVIMDEIYERLKEIAVGRGLMVGQFHPACDERAVRNPGFRVSRAPIGLFAVRRMAPHDVLFLHGDARWFGVYRERFGTHFSRGKVRDPLMRELYRNAQTPLCPAIFEDASSAGEQNHRIATAALTNGTERRPWRS
jgi:heptaprenyl diphosphate synthase